jgi:large subunit ribosomal protein L35Ae
MPGNTDTQPVRLYVKGVMVGFTGGQRTQHTHTSLIKLQGVDDKESTDFYMGKRLVYIYKAEKPVNGTRYRAIWGKVMRSHGNNGVVRAKFRRNLPAAAMGGPVRCMLYPSRV